MAVWLARHVALLNQQKRCDVYFVARSPPTAAQTNKDYNNSF